MMCDMVERDKREMEKCILEVLPGEILGFIMEKMDISSICSISTTCKTFNSLASKTLFILPNLHVSDTPLPINLLMPLISRNPNLQSLRADCRRLKETPINYLLRPSLQHLYLHNCIDCYKKLASKIGECCRDLRCLYLDAIVGRRAGSYLTDQLRKLVTGCSQLQSLTLKIGDMSSEFLSGILFPSEVAQQHLSHTVLMLPNIQKLCISVDSISDTLVGAISRCLPNLIHLDLEDAPYNELIDRWDLSNSGLQLINQHGRLKYLSLVRKPRYRLTYFRRVDDLGIISMVDRCSNIESVSLAGFCRVTNSGFRAILLSCPKLQKLWICHGTKMTNSVFHDISATSLSLTSVSLRWCYLLTNSAVASLVYNMNIKFLDLRGCRNLGDEALTQISTLHKLKILLLDGLDISDIGLTYLGNIVLESLTSLSVRGCKRLTDNCITSIFYCSSQSGRGLQHLDLSNLPNLTDDGILLLAKTRVPIIELRMRECPQIGDASVIALATMHVEEDGWNKSCLKLIDLYGCEEITWLAFQWFKKPYLLGLRWLGVDGSNSEVLVDDLVSSRPFMHIAVNGEELGIGHWDGSDGGLHKSDHKRINKLGQGILEGEGEMDTDTGSEADADDGYDWWI